MDINGIVINTRARTPWQAINLGVVIARAWYWPLFLSWFIPSAVFGLAIALLFPGLMSWLPILLVWWLKPCWDRGPLFMASRRFFNEPVSVGETLKQLPRLYLKDGLLWLTLRRFSLTRSYDQPVTCLEGLTGKARRSRLTILHREGSGESVQTLLLLVHLEMILMIAVVSLFYLLIPEQFVVDVMQLFKHDLSLDMAIYNLLYFLAMAAVAPFYTVCGFSQYINRRIGLEGWGIELQFRQLVKNHSSAAASLSAFLPLLFAGIFLFLSPAPLQAEGLDSESAAIEQRIASEAEASEQRELRTTITEILSGEEFHQKREQTHVRLKNSQTMKSDEVPQWLISFAEFLERHDGTFSSWGDTFNAIANFFASLALGVEIILWCLLAALIIWVIYLYRESLKHLLNGATRPAKKMSDEPEQLFGLDIRSASLPEKPLEVVKKLWQSHEHREAISLLYRATLIHLINERQLAFRAGYTEYDCYTTVKAAYPDAPLTDYFAKLSRAWEMIAYAHRVPDEASVELLLAQWIEMVEYGQ
ncbi:MAG TPA: DUF4129 domain-containing protein [Cellvibrio sp.]|nr:DUF4129 domain-containing protein [Cellvibrio sp.]